MRQLGWEGDILWHQCPLMGQIWKKLWESSREMKTPRTTGNVFVFTTKELSNSSCHYKKWVYNVLYVQHCLPMQIQWMTHLWYLGFYNLPHCIALVANIGRPWRKLINRISKWKELKLNFATVIAHWGLLLLYNEANNFKWNDSFYVSGEFARRSDFKFWDSEVFFVLTPEFNSLQLLNLLRS